MADPTSNSQHAETTNTPEKTESFGEILSQFQKSHSRKKEGQQQLEGTVIAVTNESVFFDIGFKSEGILPLTALQGEALKPGDKALVTVKGRDLDGYYELSRFKVERPMDWTALEKAFAEKSSVLGTVTAVIKGGFTVEKCAERTGVTWGVPCAIHRFIMPTHSPGPERKPGSRAGWR